VSISESNSNNDLKASQEMKEIWMNGILIKAYPYDLMGKICETLKTMNFVFLRAAY